MPRLKTRKKFDPDGEGPHHWKTAQQIEALPPGLHAYVGGGNLYVKVSPNGKGRSFVFRYTSPTGKDRKKGLGSCDTKTIEEAIELAREWQEVRNGTSPKIQDVARHLKIRCRNQPCDAVGPD